MEWIVFWLKVYWKGAAKGLGQPEYSDSVVVLEKWSTFGVKVILEYWKRL